MELILYENIPCPILLKKEPDTFLIFFKNEQKWIFRCSFGYGEIEKGEYGICYLFNGEYHREDGPACEYINGDKEWFINGKLHREDGPAIERSIGGKKWYQNGLLHREDGPAIDHGNGTKKWFKNGKLHRYNGPAIEWYDGEKRWYINGKLHRSNGPAVEWGNKKEWYIKGKQCSEEEYFKKIEEMKRDGTYNL